MSSNKVKRLLCIVSTMNTGGAETFLMKIYRELDKSMYQMDFYCMSEEIGFYEDEIRNLGGRIYHSIPKSKNLIKSFVGLKNIIKNEKYDYVMRISEHSLATLDLLAAKLGGAKILIQRSSNANSLGKVNRILHFLFKWLPTFIPNIKIAPSIKAAEYTFGRRAVKNKNVVILNNAIKVDDFIFNTTRRNKIIEEFNLEGSLVVGHVGRFNYQKNHSYLLDVFLEISKVRENSNLLLVGEGELENKIKKKIMELGLQKKVIFTGVRRDVADVMMAMDVLIFPSFYEGMPNTVIEAQASGLPCIISDTITKEAAITNLVSYKSLSVGPKSWANEALKQINSNKKRLNLKDDFVENGYDIANVTRIFEDLIFKS